MNQNTLLGLPIEFCECKNSDIQNIRIKDFSEWLVPMSDDEIKFELEKLEIKPGDAVLVKVRDRILNEAEAAMVRSRIEKLVAPATRIMIVDKDLELEVATPQDKNTGVDMRVFRDHNYDVPIGKITSNGRRLIVKFSPDVEITDDMAYAIFGGMGFRALDFEIKDGTSILREIEIFEFSFEKFFYDAIMSLKSSSNNTLGK